MVWRAGRAIHHAMLDAKLTEKADAAGVSCLLRIEDQLTQPMPKPEDFLLQQLSK